MRAVGTICRSLPVATCLSQTLFCPASSITWAMYLPSGETAALNALPVVVNLASFTVSKGGLELRRQTNTAAITNTTAITARAGQSKVRLKEPEAGLMLVAGSDAR